MIIFITPPTASEPYNIEAEPFNTSMRSTVSRLENSDGDNTLDTDPFTLDRIPSMRTTILEEPFIYNLLDV